MTQSGLLGGHLVATLVVSLSTSCAAPPKSAVRSRAAPAPGAAPSAISGRAEPSPATSAEPGHDETAAVVAAAMVETSRARELPAREPVRGVALSRARMAEQVRQSIEREVPKEVVDDEGEVLVALGLVPVDFDYVGAVTKLMGAELAGYYEPAEKTMYLAADLGRAERQATLAHELVHALQDQHYDLAKLLDYRPDESDRQGAVHALAEGDATSAMLDQVLAHRGQKATDLSDELVGLQVRAAAQFSSVSGEVPGVLTRSMIAPYTDGIAFVHWLRRRGGWAEVDGAWQRPPTSTEQVLHPEKFLTHEAPVPIPAPDASRSVSMTRVYTDVFGEQAVRIVLEEWLPRRTAVAASSGWGGDRIALFRQGDRSAAVWHLRADDGGAARGLASGLLRGAGTQGTVRPAKDGGCVDRAERGPLRVTRVGRDVVVIGGPYRRVDGHASPAGSCESIASWARDTAAQR